MTPKIEAKSSVFRFADVTVREREFMIARAGRVQQVEPKAFRVLLMLLRNPNKLIAKEEFLTGVWGDTAVTENSLARNIALLRRLLGDDPREPRFIETVSSIGYRFLCPVEASDETAGNLDLTRNDDLRAPNGNRQANGHIGLAADVSSPQTPANIASASRFGYRFMGPVEVAEVPDNVHSPLIAADTPKEGADESDFGRPRGNRKAPLRRLWIWPVGAAMVLVLAWFLRPALPSPTVIGTIQLTHEGKPMTWQQDINEILATDGSRVYFQEITPRSYILKQVSTQGGEAFPVNPPFYYVLDDISPDGTEILFSARPPSGGDPALWRMRLPTAQPQRIPNLPASAYGAVFSPDGRSLYYISNSDIFTAGIDGNNPRKLLTAPGVPSGLRVSPDGRLLRFNLSMGDLNKIPFWDTAETLWEAHSDGSHFRRLLADFHDGGGPCCGNWTPDGKYYVFEVDNGTRSTIWAMREAGDFWHKVSHQPVQLTHDEMITDVPLPSKDGKRIFFIGKKFRGEVMRFDLVAHALTPFLPGFSASGLSFTKDGQRLTYVSYPDGILWQSKADGSDRRQLTFPPMTVGSAQWSPDGSRIAFSAKEPRKRSQVYVVSALGGEPEKVTSCELDCNAPNWSPDGNSLLYAGPAPWWTAKYPLQILNLKTRQVTAVPDSAGMFASGWSPNGRFLLAGRMDGLIMLYDFGLRTWNQLNKDKLEVNYPTWTPDSKCIDFNSVNEKGSPEYQICLADRKVRRLGDMAQAGSLVIAGTGWWTGLAPDGSILALRDTSTEEIYALDLKLP